MANDCYKVGAFLVAAKAFDTLQRLDDSDPEFWEGKRGACVGVLQQVSAWTRSRGALLCPIVNACVPDRMRVDSPVPLQVVAGMEGKPLVDGKAKSLVAYHEVSGGGRAPGV